MAAHLFEETPSSEAERAPSTDALGGGTPSTPPSEAARAPAADAMRAFGKNLAAEAVCVPAAEAASAFGQEPVEPPSEAVGAPTADVTATWLNPGFPPSPLRLTRDGMVAYNAGPPHGLAARVTDGQLLLCFHHRGEGRLAVPHLLRPVALDGSHLTWRTHDAKEVLVLHSTLGVAALPPLTHEGAKGGLWFAPGREPARAVLAPGGAAIVDGAVAWWGMAQPSAAKTAVLVFMIRTLRGEEPVVLRELAPGIWRCAAQRFVFVDDQAPPPRLQPSDLPTFVLRERLQRGFLWLHPGRAPQTVSLVEDGRVAWSEVGGRVSGPANGEWKSRKDGEKYLSVNFHAFGEESRMRSTLLKPVAASSMAWHAVGTVEPSGVLQFVDPHQLAHWHVLALEAQLPLKRPSC